MVIFLKRKTRIDKDVEKLKLSYITSWNVNGARAVENCLVVPQQVKHKLPYDPAIPLLGRRGKKKKWKTGVQTEMCTPMLTAAVFEIAKRWKQPKHSSTDEWTNMWCIHKMNIIQP